MASFMYKEISPYPEESVRWNDVTINAGAYQSTLQDIKLPESAGCFTYRRSGDFSCSSSNRFIYWRTNHDVVELVETSLDLNLRGNHLRMHFQNTPILRGLSIHETHDKVVVLVATVSAIHKLMFPHPSQFDTDHKMMRRREQIVPSIFFDTSNSTIRDRSCYFVLNNISQGIPLPHTSCSWLINDGSAAFVLANSTGSLLLVVMSDHRGVEIVSSELMKTPAIMRLINGFVPSVIRGNHNDVAVSVICHQDSSDVFIFALFSDLQLRMWSYKKQECLMVTSMLNFDTENNLTAGNFTAHQCCLQKSVEKFGSEFCLGVHIPTLQQKHFYIFNLLPVVDKYKLSLVSTMHQSEHDLVDFCLNSRQVWTLWLSSENQPVVLVSSLDHDERSELQSNWIPIELTPRVSRNIDLEDNQNASNVYLKEIFKSGRFLSSTILKAIGIYNTSLNLNMNIEILSEYDELRSRVKTAVESEASIKSSDSMDLDQEELNAECWDRFFSYCIQYHEVGMKPLGLSLDPITGCVIVIKRNFYSILCPCDSLELMASTTPGSCFSSYFFSSAVGEDMKLRSILTALLTCVNIVRENVNPELLTKFEHKLLHQSSPIKYATEICKGLNLDLNSNFLKQLTSKLPSNTDIISALTYILTTVDLNNKEKDIADTFIPKYPLFMSSSSGVSALCAGLSQFVKQRYEFCRDILLFEIVLWGLEASDGDQLETLMMQSNIIPSTVSLLRCYYVILWCTKFDCEIVSHDVQEIASKQIAILELPEYSKSTDESKPMVANTLVHLFLRDQGGREACRLMEYQLSIQESGDNLVSLLPMLVLSAASLLWPIEGSFLFSEFLYTRCQYGALLNYNNLLNSWCAWNKQSRNFLAASSLLISRDFDRAIGMFIEVSKEIEGEYFLCNKLMKGRYSSSSSVISLYCMRVIQMLEQFNNSQCIIQLASMVIDEVDETDAHVPIFYSVLFKHCLELGYIEKAFTVLTKNPDVTRRKDCLRQLIVKLCERRQFQQIINISFLALEEDAINILESRARCSDLKNQIYYDLLYSIHIHHKKYRKAACVMYEHGMRLGREMNNLEGLEKQASCYLAAINCLHLAEPEYAWIVKPATSTASLMDRTENLNINSSPKRNSDGDEIDRSSPPIKIEVIGLTDIKREYDLVRSRLLHARRCHGPSNSTSTPLSADETVALLVSASLFEAAIQLAKSHSLSLTPVFETLAYRCVSSMLYTDIENHEDNEALTFLRQNNPSLALTNHYISARYQIWYLLKYYLTLHEKEDQTELHRCVAEKLMSNGIELPVWLKHSYQKRNATELLSLYVSHGCLQDAVELTVGYIKAVLGERKEDFNVKFTLHANSPAVWLPHTYIDILLDAMSDLQDNEIYQELFQKLTQTLDDYNKMVEAISTTKLKC